MPSSLNPSYGWVKMLVMAPNSPLPKPLTPASRCPLLDWALVLICSRLSW